MLMYNYRQRTGLLVPLGSLNSGQLRMDTEVFTTSVYNSSVSSHSPLHDNRMFLAILNFLFHNI